jgi:uncharacterized protein YacL (UPF0231 family)
MATRIYKVTSQSGTYLVRASTRNQAIAHIAKDEIAANVATQDDIVSLMQDGRKVIEVKEDQMPLNLGGE